MRQLADVVRARGGNVNRILSDEHANGVDVHQLNCTYYSRARGGRRAVSRRTGHPAVREGRPAGLLRGPAGRLERPGRGRADRRGPGGEPTRLHRAGDRGRARATGGQAPPRAHPAADQPPGVRRAVAGRDTRSFAATDVQGSREGPLHPGCGPVAGPVQRTEWCRTGTHQASTSALIVAAPWFAHRGNPFGDPLERGPVRDPRRTSAPPGLDERDRALEVPGRGVAAGQEGQLAAMELRVVEREVALEEPDEHEAAAVAPRGRTRHASTPGCRWRRRPASAARRPARRRTRRPASSPGSRTSTPASVAANARRSALTSATSGRTPRPAGVPRRPGRSARRR